MKTMKYEIYTSRNESILVSNIKELNAECSFQRFKKNRVICIYNLKTGENMNDRFDNLIG